MHRLRLSVTEDSPRYELHITNVYRSSGNADTLVFEGSEGLPFVFRSFEALGETPAERAIGADSSARPTSVTSRHRERELPLDGAVIHFSARR